MKKAITVVFLLTNVIIFSFCFSPGYCQYQTRSSQVRTSQPQLLAGKIVDVDFVSSKVTIKYPQDNGNNDEITLSVTSYTKISKGDLRISFSDLSEGDEVTVEYYYDSMSFGVPKISWLKVKPLF